MCFYKTGFVGIDGRRVSPAYHKEGRTVDFLALQLHFRQPCILSQASNKYHIFLICFDTCLTTGFLYTRYPTIPISSIL